MNRPSDEAIVHGCIIVALCVAGFMRGFNIAITGGIVAILIVHYRRDYLPHKSSLNSKDIGFDRLAFDVEQLKEKVTQLNALIAFKTGLAGRTPGAPQGVQPTAR